MQSNDPLMHELLFLRALAAVAQVEDDCRVLRDQAVAARACCARAYFDKASHFSLQMQSQARLLLSNADAAVTAWGKLEEWENKLHEKYVAPGESDDC